VGAHPRRWRCRRRWSQSSSGYRAGAGPPTSSASCCPWASPWRRTGHRPPEPSTGPTPSESWRWSRCRMPQEVAQCTRTRQRPSWSTHGKGREKPTGKATAAPTCCLTGLRAVRVPVALRHGHAARGSRHGCCVAATGALWLSCCVPHSPLRRAATSELLPPLHALPQHPAPSDPCMRVRCTCTPLSAGAAPPLPTRRTSKPHHHVWSRVWRCLCTQPTHTGCQSRLYVHLLFARAQARTNPREQTPTLHWDRTARAARRASATRPVRVQANVRRRTRTVTALSLSAAVPCRCQRGGWMVSHTRPGGRATAPVPVGRVRSRTGRRTCGVVEAALRSRGVAPKQIPGQMALIIVRHGERQDYADPTWVAHQKQTDGRPWDPPLTARGKRQAVAAGQRLLQECAQLGVPQPSQVYSSPFTRCVETAVEIATATGLPTVNVEPSLSEDLGEKWCVSPGRPSIRQCGILAHKQEAEVLIRPTKPYLAKTLPPSVVSVSGRSLIRPGDSLGCDELEKTIDGRCTHIYDHVQVSVVGAGAVGRQLGRTHRAACHATDGGAAAPQSFRGAPPCCLTGPCACVDPPSTVRGLWTVKYRTYDISPPNLCRMCSGREHAASGRCIASGARL